jgi:hypothetical protein
MKSERTGRQGAWALALARAAAGLALIAAILVPRVGGVAEGDTKEFRFFNFDFKGERHDREIVDVNGDGLLDLVMAYSTAAERDVYYLRVCLQSKEQGFSSACSEMKLPAGARAFDVGEIDGSPGAELVLLTDSDAMIASFSGAGFGALKKASADNSILAGTSEKEPRLLRCLWDINEDKKKELIFPTIKGPAVYKFDNGNLALIQQISSPAFVTYRVGSLGDISHTDDLNQFLRYRSYEKRVSTTFTAPDVFVVDFNGDKKLDVVTLIDNTLKVFPQVEGGKFADKPALTFKREILPAKERGLGFAGEAMTFADLNGDGIWDIIMMKWGASQEKTKMDRYIYYGQPGLKYNDKPDQIIGSENAAVDFGMHDLNHDGKTDLVIPFFHFAPAAAFKIITENSIKIQFWVFLMKPDGKYTQDAGQTYAKVDTRVPLTYKIDILGMLFDIRTLIEGKFQPLISFNYDFNGDGFLDLVADTGDDHLQIYYGNDKAQYPTQPNLSVDLESATDYNIADLNGDGKSDVITYYESKERTSKRRELAKKAREAADAGPVNLDEEVVTTAEGTRIKILLSK